MARPRPSELTLLNRFWKSVLINIDGCWEWQKAVNPETQYGTMRWDGLTKTAHRISWEFHFGDPGELHVLHKCDNRKCVRPDHLFLGTNLDNILDSMRKGRRKRPWQKVPWQRKEAA